MFTSKVGTDDSRSQDITGVKIKLQGSLAGCHITLYRQLGVKDLRTVPTWWLEWGSNLRLCGCKAPTLPLSPHAHKVKQQLRQVCYKNYTHKVSSSIW